MFARRFYCLDVQTLLDATTLFIELFVVLQVRLQKLHPVLLSMCGDYLLRGRLSAPLLGHFRSAIKNGYYVNVRTLSKKTK